MTIGAGGLAGAGRRAFDLMGSLLLIAVSLPLMGLLALAVYGCSGRPALHREVRLGRHARPFTLYKFRSLEVGSGTERSVAPDDDPRQTRIGRLLRRSRLDELPQLFSVLRGEMSLVGPRPLPPAHARSLPATDLDRLLAVRPGLTGAAAVSFIAEDAALAGRPDPEALYLRVLLPRKVAQELDYLDRRCLRGDLGILLRTLQLACSDAARDASRARVEAILAAASTRDEPLPGSGQTADNGGRSQQ